MKFLFAVFLFTSTVLYSQERRMNEIDILHYDLDITINDSSDVISAIEHVTVAYNSKCDSFYLDLISMNSSGKGMFVHEIKNINYPYSKVEFKHSDDKLWIYVDGKMIDDSSKFSIVFHGKPIDGLVIGKNKFGKRTFFGDNWPNRAHNWFACVDHPSDKASVNFTIKAPKHYRVIATGLNRVDSTRSASSTTTHYFESTIQLPTKVMVFGAADFQTQLNTEYSTFPLSTWLYSDEDEKVFHDLDPSISIIDFFSEKIGEYPFEKLVNVQSTTRYGGMENAGNIFYDENAFTGKGTMEALIAHEIAHQWFGNSASESDWQHLWLSEGFATYFTDLYWENMYGTNEMNKRLKNERSKVIRFSKQYNHAVIDTNYTNLLHLLNPNSYQKGAWVLHMLRNEVGEDVFWEIIKTYYEEYKYSNANSFDFIEIVNRITKKDYSYFFNQWLRRNGQPKLKTEIKQKGKKINLEFRQIQKGKIFSFPIEILFIYKDGTKEVKKYNLNKEVFLISFKTDKKLDHFIVDPNVLLLFEE